MPAHLHDTLPFLLNRIAAKVTEAVHREFQPMGLSIFAVRVLILLHLDEASTVGELAEKAALEQSTLSHILRRLQTDGLLVKLRLAQDNRSVMVCLTKRGQRTAAICWTAVKNHDSLIRKGLHAADVKALKRLLVRIYDNVPAFQRRERDLEKKAERSARTNRRRRVAAARP